MARFWCSEADSSASASLADACSMISFSNPSAARRKTVSALPSYIGQLCQRQVNLIAVWYLIPCGKVSSLLPIRFQPCPFLLTYQRCLSIPAIWTITIIHDMCRSSHSLLHCSLSVSICVGYNDDRSTYRLQALAEQSSTC